MLLSRVRFVFLQLSTLLLTQNHATIPLPRRRRAKQLFNTGGALGQAAAFALDRLAALLPGGLWTKHARNIN
jgi:hypothetical protein